MDVGVAALVVLRHRLDDRAGLLAGGRRVEIDQAVAVDLPLEDREVAARLLVEPHDPSACLSTVIGSVTQRMRVGRMSACRTASTSPASSARASDAAWPWIISVRTSEDAVEMGHESPVKRAASTTSPASRTITRTRSPQSGLTSSAEALAPGRSPRKRGRRQRSRITSL